MSDWRDAVALLVADLRQIFASRLRSVVAYGPHLEGDTRAPITCLALVDSVGLSDLDACAARAAQWSRRHLAIPLVLSDEEFRRSLDAFPLEYGEILRAHEPVFGGSPFDGVAVAREDLRRACESQIKSHLLHLRETYIESAASPDVVADLVRNAAPAFTALLRSVARLSGTVASDRVEATREGARVAGLEPGIVEDLAGLERGTDVPLADPARLFPDYLRAVEQLARAVDTWRL